MYNVCVCLCTLFRPDMSLYLKEHGIMTEKEARGIIIQVLSALRYVDLLNVCIKRL